MWVSVRLVLRLNPALVLPCSFSTNVQVTDRKIIFLLNPETFAFGVYGLNILVSHLKQVKSLINTVREWHLFYFRPVPLVILSPSAVNRLLADLAPRHSRIQGMCLRIISLLRESIYLTTISPAWSDDFSLPFVQIYFTYLKVTVSQHERHTDFSSFPNWSRQGSFPNWSRQLGLGRAEPSSQQLYDRVSHVDGRGSGIWDHFPLLSYVH